MLYSCCIGYKAVCASVFPIFRIGKNQIEFSGSTKNTDKDNSGILWFNDNKH